jgi:O-antigen/teichoic acid export membrane protein
VTSSPTKNKPSRRDGVLFSLRILTLGQIVSQLANMAALVFLASYLGAHWFGVIQVGVALMSYALITAEWGMMSLGIREISRMDEPHQIFGYARQHMSQLALQAVGVLVIGLLVLPRLPFYQQDHWVFLLYLSAVIPQIYTQNWVAVGMEKMVYVGVSRIVRGLVYALLVVLLLRHLDGVWGVPGHRWVPIMFLVAMVGSNLTVNIPLARRLGSFVHPGRITWTDALRRWREASSIGTNIIILRMLFNIDIIILGSMAAPEVAGNYAAASRIMFLLVIGVEVLWAALLPRLSRLARESRAEFSRSFNLYFGLVAALLLPSAVGGYLVGTDFVDLLYEGKFPEAGPVFQILAVSYSLLALGTFLGNTLLADDRQKWYLLPLVASSIAAIVGVVLLVPAHAGLGASWAMLIAHSLLFMVLMVVHRGIFSRALGGMFLGILPSLVAMALAIDALSGNHVLLRIAAATLVYLLLAAWPVRRFQANARLL